MEGSRVGDCMHIFILSRKRDFPWYLVAERSLTIAQERPWRVSIPFTCKAVFHENRCRWRCTEAVRRSNGVAVA